MMKRNEIIERAVDLALKIVITKENNKKFNQEVDTQRYDAKLLMLCRVLYGNKCSKQHNRLLNIVYKIHEHANNIAKKGA